MKLVQIAIINFILLIISSCSHYIINEAGYIRPPENYRFSYKRKSTKLENNDLIDTTAIYYLHNSNYYRDSDKYKNSEHYIRFYSNGKFKLQGTKGTPKIEDVNDINKGIIGYYKLKGRVVKLQVYSDINGGSDQLEFGIINETGDLIIVNENPRTFYFLGFSEKGIKRKIAKTSFFNPKRYEKLNLNNMKYTQPDW